MPHVHVHVLPRRAGDFEKNDAVYDAIDAQSRARACAPPDPHHAHVSQRQASVLSLRSS